MSIFFKDIISTFNEAIHAYDRAEYSVLTFGNDTFRTILLFMWIGAVFAFIASYYNNHYLGGFVEKLILSGATSKKNAKTLEELGLSGKRLLKYSLRDGSTLRKCVLAKNDPIPTTSEFYKGIGTDEDESAKAHTVGLSDSQAESDISEDEVKTDNRDVGSIAFYIPETLLGKAQKRYRKNGNGIWMLILSIVVTAFVLLLLAIYAPLILGFVDNALVSFKG